MERATSSYFDPTGGQAATADDAVSGSVAGDDLASRKSLERAYARCFLSDDGKQVLAHLRNVTLNRTLGPSCTEAVLRHLEGQRQLVTYIISLIDRGRRVSST